MRADLKVAKQEIGKKYKRLRQNADISTLVKPQDEVKRKGKN